MESGKAQSFPSILQAIGLLGVAFILNVLVAVPFDVYDYFFHQNTSDHPLTLAVVNLVSLGAVIFFAARKRKEGIRTLVGVKPFSPVLLLPMGMMIFGLFILLPEIGSLVELFIPMPADIAEFFADLVRKDGNLFGATLALTLVAPLTEEILFRGVLLRGFLQRYAPTTAIGVSAFLFGAFHLNPWQFVPGVVLGALFAWWYTETGSLIPAFAGHAAYNGLPVVLAFFFRDEMQAVSTTELLAIEFQPIGWIIAGAVFLFAGMLLFMKITSGSNSETVF